jgi:arylsulfatase A-like enzyme
MRRSRNGRSARRGRSDAVVSLLDFAPTVLDYAGIDQGTLAPARQPPAPPYELPGRSLKGAVQRKASLSEQSALVEFDGDGFRMRGIVVEHFKLALYTPSDEGVLFDLENDPNEICNLWNDPAHARTKTLLLHELLNRLTWTDRLDTTRLCDC